MQDNTRLALVQLERTLHFSLSRCRQSFLSRDDMLDNISHHVLLIYRIYRIGLQGYLQLFANINILRRDGILTSIYDTMVAHGHLMGWVHMTRHSSGRSNNYP